MYHSLNTSLINTCRFRVGTKATLPAAIIVATCLEYASFDYSGSKTLNISRLLYDVGSPGRVFKLTEEALCSAIENIAKENPQITLSDTAGLIQLSFKTDDLLQLAKDILDNYYD